MDSSQTKELLKEFIVLQYSRISVYKNFDQYLKDLKNTSQEKIYQKRVQNITKEFIKISKSIIEISEKLKSPYKDYLKRIQELEKKHLLTESVFHSLEWKKCKAEKRFKIVTEGEKIIENQNMEYFPMNNFMLNDKESVRGENINMIQTELKKAVKEKGKVMSEINDLFEEIKLESNEM